MGQAVGGRERSLRFRRAVVGDAQVPERSGFVVARWGDGHCARRVVVEQLHRHARRPDAAVGRVGARTQDDQAHLLVRGLLRKRPGRAVPDRALMQLHHSRRLRAAGQPCGECGGIGSAW
jgi:hypothetical protein